jgi:hypothetical protein
VFLFDSDTCERIYPNEFLHRIDNDVLSGYMLAMISTDDNNVPHFHGRKRKVEFQFQFKFKEVPEHPLFIGSELKGSSTRISILQKALLKTIASSIEKRNQNFIYNLGTGEDNTYKDGDKVQDDGSAPDQTPRRGAYMAMPFESSVNALVVTSKGEMPPALGEAIENMNIQENKKIEFNTSDTYTFAIWSANFDLINWKCTSRSTIQPFGLNTLIGGQPFSLSVYSMNPFTKRIKRYFELEISHKLSQVGPARRVWLSNAKTLRFSSTDSLLDNLDDVIVPSASEGTLEERNDLDSTACQRSCMCWAEWAE